MIHIPSTYIIYSRFSTLEPKDVLKIIHLAEQKWNEREINERLQIPEKPFIGVGITNPQELDIVMRKQNIPIIHIHADCKSLQANQRHKLERQYYWHRFLWFSESAFWGIIGYLTIEPSSRRTNTMDSFITTVTNRRWISTNSNLFRFQNWISRAALITLCLYTTKRLVYHQIQKQEYRYIANSSTFLLLRNDIVTSKCQYILSKLLPSVLISSTVYILLTNCCNKATL